MHHESNQREPVPPNNSPKTSKSPKSVHSRSPHEASDMTLTTPATSKTTTTTLLPIPNAHSVRDRDQNHSIYENNNKLELILPNHPEVSVINVNKMSLNLSRDRDVSTCPPITSSSDLNCENNT